MRWRFGQLPSAGLRLPSFINDPLAVAMPPPLTEIVLAFFAVLGAEDAFVLDFALALFFAVFLASAMFVLSVELLFKQRRFL
jgi:hypothetical protein